MIRWSHVSSLSSACQSRLASLFAATPVLIVANAFSGSINNLCYYFGNLYAVSIRRVTPYGGIASWQSEMNTSKENGCYVTSDTQSEPTTLIKLYYLHATLAIWTRTVASPCRVAIFTE